MPHERRIRSQSASNLLGLLKQSSFLKTKATNRLFQESLTPANPNNPLKMPQKHVKAQLLDDQIISKALPRDPTKQKHRPATKMISYIPQHLHEYCPYDSMFEKCEIYAIASMRDSKLLINIFCDVFYIRILKK